MRLKGRRISGDRTRVTDAVLLDGHTLNLRGLLPGTMVAGRPATLKLSAFGRPSVELPVTTRVVEGVPEWIVAHDLSALSGTGPWWGTLVQDGASAAVVTKKLRRSPNHKVVRPFPASPVDGTRYSLVKAGNGRLAVLAEPPRPAARVARVINAPGVLRVDVTTQRLAPEAVVDAVVHSRVKPRGIPLPVRRDGGVISVSVPLERLAARQEVDVPVRWRLSLRGPDGTVRVGRIGDDLEVLASACTFASVVSVAADGSRTRARPMFNDKQALDVRVTRLVPAAGTRASERTGAA